jgi:hypothetical protein
MSRYRLVENAPIARWLLGRPDPFRPLFDVEEIGPFGCPERVIAWGIEAETARKLIEKIETGDSSRIGGESGTDEQ